MNGIVYIIISVLFNVLGQFAIKLGTNKLGSLHISLHSIISDVIHIIFYPYIFGGLFLYGIGSIFWILALSKTELSIAYPLLSMGYILILFLSWLILKENINFTRILGVLVIVVGIFLISKSA